MADHSHPKSSGGFVCCKAGWRNVKYADGDYNVTKTTAMKCVLIDRESLHNEITQKISSVGRQEGSCFVPR